jgi:hypothetical protein
VNYADSTKHRRMLVVRDDIDAGSSFGKLQVWDAGEDLLAEIVLADPASQVVGNTWTLLGVPLEAVGISAGQGATVRITDSDGNDVIELNVGTDVILSTAEISVGRTVRVISASITHG